MSWHCEDSASGVMTMLEVPPALTGVSQLSTSTWPVFIMEIQSNQCPYP